MKEGKPGSSGRSGDGNRVRELLPRTLREAVLPACRTLSCGFIPFKAGPQSAVGLDLTIPSLLELENCNDKLKVQLTHCILHLVCQGGVLNEIL